MRRAALRGAAAALALCAGPAAATEDAASPAPAQCAVLAPVFLSSWLGLLDAIGRGARDEIAATAARTADLLALHDALGCAPAPLAEATDCLTARLAARATAPADNLATDCMRRAGLLEP